MTSWRQGEPKIWRWRIRGRASDGQVVTLGKYDTQSEAKVEHDKIVAEGSYRNVRLEQITTPSAPSTLSTP